MPTARSKAAFKHTRDNNVLLCQLLEAAAQCIDTAAQPIYPHTICLLSITESNVTCTPTFIQKHASLTQASCNIILRSFKTTLTELCPLVISLLLRAWLIYWNHNFCFQPESHHCSFTHIYGKSFVWRWKKLKHPTNQASKTLRCIWLFSLRDANQTRTCYNM